MVELPARGVVVAVVSLGSDARGLQGFDDALTGRLQGLTVVLTEVGRNAARHDNHLKHAMKLVNSQSIDNSENSEYSNRF